MTASALSSPDLGASAFPEAPIKVMFDDSSDEIKLAAEFRAPGTIVASGKGAKLESEKRMLVRPRAGAVSARSEYSISVSPIRTMSRSRSCTGAVNLAALTSVPLALPRSVIQNASPRLRTSASSREAKGSSTHTSFRAQRPIVIRGRFKSTTESPCAGVALTIKRGIEQIRRGEDKGTSGQGDKGTRKKGDFLSLSPCPPFSLSLPLASL